jgi:dTDP-4-dehydrorhamnose 3,5-epimerase
MIFHRTKLSGVVEIELDLHRDERGFFARSWCQKEFETEGLNSKTVQCNVSFNEKKGTLRGMHFQAAPSPEAKLVRCTQGVIHDVAIDLRAESPTYKQWIGVDLSGENRRMLYIPEGCAHGFLTLEDKTEILYQMSEFYCPELARGFRWDDPAFQIKWPATVEVISERDRTYPDFESVQCTC